MKKGSLLILCLLSSTVFAQETLRERFRERMADRIEQRRESQINNSNTGNNVTQDRGLLRNRTNQTQSTVPAQESLPAGVTQYSINVQGQNRYYYEYGQERNGHNQNGNNFNNKKEVVLIYHGGDGSAPNFMNQTKFISMAKEDQILVFLNAEDKNWFDGRSGMESRKDIDFTNTVIRAYQQKGIRKFSATGFSNGAIFTLRLACEGNTDIENFAAISGSFASGLQCNARNGKNVLMMNGTSDNYVKWNGGEIPHSGKTGVGGSVISVPDTAHYWQNKYHCEPRRENDQNNNRVDNSNVEISSYMCHNGGFKFYQINGGGHTIPGSTPNPKMEKIVGQTNQDIVAESEIFKFFDNHN